MNSLSSLDGSEGNISVGLKEKLTRETYDKETGTIHEPIAWSCLIL